MHIKVYSHINSGQVNYKEHIHSAYSLHVKNPSDFAYAIGYDISRIFKTLFMCCPKEEKYLLATLPVDKKVDMSLLRKAASAKKIELANNAELFTELGYPRAGVSPLGVWGIPVFVDRSILDHETVLVGSGEIGAEIEIDPKDLIRLTNSVVIDLQHNF